MFQQPSANPRANPQISAINLLKKQFIILNKHENYLGSIMDDLSVLPKGASNGILINVAKKASRLANVPTNMTVCLLILTFRIPNTSPANNYEIITSDR